MKIWVTNIIYGNKFTVSGPWQKKIVQRFLFLWKVCGKLLTFSILCQKCSEVVRIDSRQLRVQRHRLDNFQWKNCSIELQFCTGFLRLLVASEVSEGVVWCVHACELWGQVWLQNFVPFRVCQEDVLKNLIEEENYSSLDRTKAQRIVFLASTVRLWQILLIL